MIVSELIEFLTTLDKNMPVIVDTGEWRYHELDSASTARMFRLRNKEFAFAREAHGGEQTVVVLG